MELGEEFASEDVEIPGEVEVETEEEEEEVEMVLSSAPVLEPKANMLHDFSRNSC